MPSFYLQNIAVSSDDPHLSNESLSWIYLWRLIETSDWFLVKTCVNPWYKWRDIMIRLAMWAVCDSRVRWAALFRGAEHFSVCVIQRKLKSIILTVTLSPAAQALPTMPTVAERIEIIREKESNWSSWTPPKKLKPKNILAKYEMTFYSNFV